MTSTAEAFKTPGQLEAWLRKHHTTRSELWVRIFKKDSGTPSVDWNDCVNAAIAWGWIDGHRKALDEVSFLQRLTPRRPKSNWSKKNCAHAEKLIAEGKMQPAGLVHVEAARQDGRWDAAYAGSSGLVIPDDFTTELRKNNAAKKFFATLNRTNLFVIYHRLQTAKKPETRARRIESMIAQLAEEKPFHGPKKTQRPLQPKT
ncbi:MAG: YdeI/OmpD-associated family protein [Polyangiaceae bacterium]